MFISTVTNDLQYVMGYRGREKHLWDTGGYFDSLCNEYNFNSNLTYMLDKELIFLEKFMDYGGVVSLKTRKPEGFQLSSYMCMYYTLGNHTYIFSSVPFMYSIFSRHISFSYLFQ